MTYQDIRRKTKEVKIGSIAIGAHHPVAIQSMTNADPHDFEGLLKQIQGLESVGCEIVRITVPDMEAVGAESFCDTTAELAEKIEELIHGK